MSLIHQLPQKVQYELKTKSLLKVISGLNNFDMNSVTMISKAATLGGADIVDIACKPELIESIMACTTLPICVSAVEPTLFVDAVSAGAKLIEIGNFDSFYKKRYQVFSRTGPQLNKTDKRTFTWYSSFSNCPSYNYAWSTSRSCN